jgi:N-acetylglucosaminyl-diphospho-decaprenol L-rhamnosyltransferase
VPHDLYGLGSLAVVIVLHASENVIADCVRALPLGIELVLVDNGGDDRSADVARAIRPDARCVSSETNLGFGGGCNLGIKATSRPVLMFLNPDARIGEASVLRLMDRLSSLPESVIGPAIMGPDGCRLRFRRGDSPIRDFAWELPAACRWLPVSWLPKVSAQDVRYQIGGAVPFVEGACFVVRRKDVNLIGGFDEDFFLYQEEASIAHRLRAIGGMAYYEPRAVASHIGGTSVKRAGSPTSYHVWRSRTLMWRKRFRGVSLAYRLGMDACALAASGGAACLRRRRDPSAVPAWRSSLRGYRDGLLGNYDPNVLYSQSGWTVRARGDGPGTPSELAP